MDDCNPRQGDIRPSPGARALPEIFLIPAGRASVPGAYLELSKVGQSFVITSYLYMRGKGATFKTVSELETKLLHNAQNDQRQADLSRRLSTAFSILLSA